MNAVSGSEKHQTKGWPSCRQTAEAHVVCVHAMRYTQLIWPWSVHGTEPRDNIYWANTVKAGARVAVLRPKAKAVGSTTADRQCCHIAGCAVYGCAVYIVSKLYKTIVFLVSAAATHSKFARCVLCRTR